jgi:hypothetical protein
MKTNVNGVPRISTGMSTVVTQILHGHPENDGDNLLLDDMETRQ